MERLFAAFEEAGKELYLVGGAVRDFALGVSWSELDDLDFCTNARPHESLEILKAGGFNTYDMGFEFGTVGCVLRGPAREGFPKDVQVTTYRSEEYYRRGSRHPEVKFGDTIEQDLGRRDFSINSMALDSKGEIVDPYDGLSDLKKGILRVIGDPLETLAEDPLRILRVGRFMSRLGFRVDAALYEAARARAEYILDISRERWLQEMTKLLKGEHVRAALKFLHEVRILGIILPEVTAIVGLHESSPVHHKDVWDHTLQVVEQAPPKAPLRWAALLHDVGKAWTRMIHADQTVTFYRHEEHSAMLFEGIARRFKFDNESTQHIGFIIENHGRTSQYSDEWTDAAVRRYVRDLDPYVESMLAFARADLTTRFEDKREAALARVDELEERIQALERAAQLRPEVPTGFGRDLMEAFELKAGPVIGDLKGYIEEAILDGTIDSGAQAEDYINYLKQNPPDWFEGRT